MDTRRAAVIRIGAAVVVLAVIGAAVAIALPARAQPNGMPADKVAVSSSVIEIIRTQTGVGATESVEKILETQLKTSGTSDLILQLTLECALWTEVGTIGSDDSAANATVEIWITLDGQPVPVTADANGDGSFDDPDDGRVTFCNRAFRMTTEFFDDDDAEDVIRLFNRTKNANGFNWTRPDPGHGIHAIEVWARLNATVEGDPTMGAAENVAMAAVGKRTLVIEPTHLPVGTNV